MRLAKDETGKRFGRLTVLNRAERLLNGAIGQGALFACRCDCGRSIVTRGSSLRNGTSTSCGCIAAEKLRASILLPEGIAARNQIIRRLKASAAERGYSWELSDAQLLGLMKRPCTYCGSPPANVSSHPEFNGSFQYGGVDRVDNFEGYTVANTVPCCKHCNYAKRDRSYDEFMAWIVRVYTQSTARNPEELQ